MRRYRDEMKWVVFWRGALITIILAILTFQATLWVLRCWR